MAVDPPASRTTYIVTGTTRGIVNLTSGAIYDLRSVRWENGRPTIAPREKA